MNYPEEPAGPFEGPPRRFEDAEGREIDIREYGERDDAGEFADVVAMYSDFAPEDRAQGIPPLREDRIRDWLDTLLGTGCLNVVAWHGSAAVGHATLVPDGDEGHELAIFVLDTHQNAGIGTRLLEALLGLAEREGVDRVWLSVERWNNPAIAIYRKIGFERVDDGSFELKMALRLG